MGSRNDRIQLTRHGTNAWRLTCREWKAFHMSGLMSGVTLNGKDLAVAGMVPDRSGTGSLPAGWTVQFKGNCTLQVEVEPLTNGFCLLPALHYHGSSRAILNAIQLWKVDKGSFGRVTWGSEPGDVHILRQANYSGSVTPLICASGSDAATKQGEPGSEDQVKGDDSQLFAVYYDRLSQRAMLTGFESSERWHGQFRDERDSRGRVCAWSAGFDGGDLEVEPGASLQLEPMVILFGNDPLALMDQYGDRVAARHPIRSSARPPVSWCSWYPYRLGLTQERMIETADIAARRLKPLGLTIIEADLGWEWKNLPSVYGENQRFAKGLKWLAGELNQRGLKLGVWKAPYMISEFDPLVKQHPEWLIPDEQGKPLPIWEWFWEPHGKVYILDLTNPEARAWVRSNLKGLHAKGVRYFKFDFIGCHADGRAKRRHDRTLVMGGGPEAGRIMAQEIRNAVKDSWILNCGGPEMPGTGHWPLLYACNDTGNTGFIVPEFQRNNTTALACHLFKNRRWGWIQPSCLCVGLPGTLEEARQRATIAFMSGGQIDLSDTLTTLPEERWRLIETTLPVLPQTARPLDLFEPVYYSRDYDYVAVCKGQTGSDAKPHDSYPGSVWHLPVKADWDEWSLVSFFAFDTQDTAAQPKPNWFVVPLERLGLDARQHWEVFEFWDQAALGVLPGGRANPGGYRHPGDFQDLLVGTDRSSLGIFYYGYGCKLICLRKRRKHPWVLATGFHQSCGTELSDVVWLARRKELRGVLNRPAGLAGQIVIQGAARIPVEARVGGRKTPLIPGSHGTYRLPLVTVGGRTPWSVRFA